MDEDAFNVLIAEGIDVPTAYAASVDDAAPDHQERKSHTPECIGMLIALGVCVACWYFWLRG